MCIYVYAAVKINAGSQKCLARKVILPAVGERMLWILSWVNRLQKKTFNDNLTKQCFSESAFILNNKDYVLNYAIR